MTTIMRLCGECSAEVLPCFDLSHTGVGCGECIACHTHIEGMYVYVPDETPPDVDHEHENAYSAWVDEQIANRDEGR